MIDPLEHQGLVREVARRYRHFGLSFDDLMAEGQIGLLIACRKFDSSLGYEFSTYAVPWISRTISLAVDRRTLVAVPQHVLERLRYPDSKTRASAAILKAGRRAKRKHMNERSLEAAYSASLADVVRDHRTKEVRRCDAALDLEVLMRGLSAHQAESVRLRYGLDGRGERTWEEIGASRGTSWQAAQQSVARAMKTLRAAAHVPEPRRASA